MDVLVGRTLSDPIISTSLKEYLALAGLEFNAIETMELSKRPRELSNSIICILRRTQYIWPIMLSRSIVHLNQRIRSI
jgi:hypothetical protein